MGRRGPSKEIQERAEMMRPWLDMARREGVIEGLERALEFVPRFTSTHQAIRAEVERLKGGA